MTEPPQFPPPTPYDDQAPGPAGYPPQGPWQPQQVWHEPTPPPEGTNGLAITALVTAFLGTLCFSSILFAIIALVQTGRTGQKGRGLAIAALIISALWLVGGVTAGVVGAITSPADRSSTGSITHGGDVVATKVRKGDCLNLSDLQNQDTVRAIPAVPCSEPHDSEVFAILELDGAEFPGLEEVRSEAETRCYDNGSTSLPRSTINDASVRLFYLHPIAKTWAHGDRRVACIVLTDEQRTGSLRD